MRLKSIGKNIRKYRLMKKLRQEDLAEKADLSINYVGAIERGEKTPSLESLIAIINALGVSADMILADVLDNGYVVKDSLLAQKLDKLSAEDRSQIYDVIDTMIKHSKQVKPQMKTKAHRNLFVGFGEPFSLLIRVLRCGASPGF